MDKFLVGTGIVTFAVEAWTPFDAIQALKDRIRAREHEHWNPDISMSLVRALKETERLVGGEITVDEAYHPANFIVFDAARTRILAGELHGEYQDQPTRKLADALRAIVPDALYFSLPCTDCNCGYCPTAVVVHRLAD